MTWAAVPRWGGGRLGYVSGSGMSCRARACPASSIFRPSAALLSTVTETAAVGRERLPRAHCGPGATLSVACIELLGSPQKLGGRWSYSNFWMRNQSHREVIEVAPGVPAGRWQSRDLICRPPTCHQALVAMPSPPPPLPSRDRGNDCPSSWVSFLRPQEPFPEGPRNLSLKAPPWLISHPVLLAARGHGCLPCDLELPRALALVD